MNAHPTDFLPMVADEPSASKVRATETALEIDSDLTLEEWQEIGHTLGRANRASAWWVGDWINYAEGKWGEKYEDALLATGLSYDYLRHCAAVSRRFTFGDRSPELTWTHHFKAKALDNAEEWLARAEAEKWSVRELLEKTSAAPPANSHVMPSRRHVAFMAAAESVVRVGERWERDMTDALTPPQARKQLTVLRKARERLDEVIDAVEYRAATVQTYSSH